MQGFLSSVSQDVTIHDNSATRYGGGSYAGLPTYTSIQGDAAKIWLTDGNVLDNTCATTVTNPLSPSQIAVQDVIGDAGGTVTAVLDFYNLTLRGQNPSTDIGICAIHCQAVHTNGINFTTLVNKLIELP